jgi:hypothetical protein
LKPTRRSSITGSVTGSHWWKLWCADEGTLQLRFLTSFTSCAYIYIVASRFLRAPSHTRISDRFAFVCSSLQLHSPLPPKNSINLRL